MNTTEITNEAIDRAEAGADPNWMQKAEDALRSVVLRQLLFTTDDLWSLVPSTEEPRAMGVIMRQAQAEGLIKATDQFKISDRPECHRRPLRVWVSRVYSSGEV